MTQPTTPPPEEDPMEVARRNRDAALGGRTATGRARQARNPAAAKRAAKPPSRRADPRRTAALEADTRVADPDSIADAVRDGEERAIAQVQAAAEGVVLDDKVEFLGEWFRISEKVGIMPLMKFAAAADAGMDTQDLGAMAAMYAVLQDVIYEGTSGLDPGDDGYDPGDWKKFEAHAIKTKADVEDMLPVVQQAVEILTSRLRGRDPAAAGGPRVDRAA
jgi:hypothetical protein